MLRFLCIPLLAFPICLHVHIPEALAFWKQVFHISTSLIYPYVFSYPRSSLTHPCYPVTGVLNTQQLGRCQQKTPKNSQKSQGNPSLLLYFKPKSDIFYKIGFFAKGKAPRCPICFSLHHFPSSTASSTCSLSKQHCQTTPADSSEEQWAVPNESIIPLGTPQSNVLIQQIHADRPPP